MKITMENKTIMEFRLQDPIDELYTDPFFSIVDLTLLYVNDKEHPYNTNHFNIAKDVVERAIPTFYNKAITFRYNSKLAAGVTDITEHSHTEEEKFDLRIGGHIPNNSKVRFVEEDGITYVKCQAILQKHYVPQLMQILKKNNGQMSISIEIAYNQAKYDEKEDVVYIEDFTLIGATILSPQIQPGIENSNIKVLKFSNNEYNAAYFSYIEKQKEENSVADDKRTQEDALKLAKLETEFAKLESEHKETLIELEQAKANFTELEVKNKELLEAQNTLNEEKQNLEQKFADYEAVKKELADFKEKKERAELEQKMSKELEDNSICFNATEFKDLESKIKDIEYEDFTKEIANKKDEFIAKLKAQTDNKDIGLGAEQFSYNHVLKTKDIDDKVSGTIKEISELLEK